jgi:hypothetical protein
MLPVLGKIHFHSFSKILKKVTLLLKFFICHFSATFCEIMLQFFGHQFLLPPHLSSATFELFDRTVCHLATVADTPRFSLNTASGCACEKDEKCDCTDCKCTSFTCKKGSTKVDEVEKK